jgi:hypothetical protein
MAIREDLNLTAGILSLSGRVIAEEGAPLWQQSGCIDLNRSNIVRAFGTRATVSVNGGQNIEVSRLTTGGPFDVRRL